jgi:hypothetical protein
MSDLSSIKITVLGADRKEELEQLKLKKLELKTNASNAIKSILSNTDITFEEFAAAVKADKDLATALLYSCMLLLRRMNPELANDVTKNINQI